MMTTRKRSTPRRTRRNPIIYDIGMNVLGNVVHEHIKRHLKKRAAAKRRRTR